MPETKKVTAKKIEKPAVKYTVGKTQKRIVTYAICALNDATSGGTAANTLELAKAAYTYGPFFLKAYPGMPKPTLIDYDGVPVTCADIEWVANNIGAEEMLQIFTDGINYNTFSDGEKKSGN